MLKGINIGEAIEKFSIYTKGIEPSKETREIKIEEIRKEEAEKIKNFVIIENEMEG